MSHPSAPVNSKYKTSNITSISAHCEYQTSDDLPAHSK